MVSFVLFFSNQLQQWNLTFKFLFGLSSSRVILFLLIRFGILSLLMQSHSWSSVLTLKSKNWRIGSIRTRAAWASCTRFTSRPQRPHLFTLEWSILPVSKQIYIHLLTFGDHMQILKTKKVIYWKIWIIFISKWYKACKLVKKWLRYNHFSLT